MPDSDEPLNANPIVAMAMKIRARKDIAGAIDSATPAAGAPPGADAAASLAAFGEAPAAPPGLINLSILSTAPTYGDVLTPNVLLKRIAQDAELPRPPHLDGLGP